MKNQKHSCKDKKNEADATGKKNGVKTNGVIKNKKDQVNTLTEKQKAFCQEYLVDLDATKAAIRAGYSAKSARQHGYQKLRIPQIQAEIRRLMQERAKRTEITQDRVLREVAKIAFADMNDFVEIRQQEGEATGENRSWGRYLKIKDSARIDGSPIAMIRENRWGVVLKLHNKIKALELLAKHLGMFKKALEVEVKGEIDIPKTFADWKEKYNEQKDNQ